MAKAKTFEESVKGTKFEGKTQEQVKNALYTSALQDLRNDHMDEFIEMVEKAYAAYGLTYKRRLTDAEKAEQQVAALLAANPGLAEKFGVNPAVVEAVEPDVEVERDEEPEPVGTV